LCAISGGVETVTLSDHTAGDFGKGQRESTCVDERGEVVLAFEQVQLLSGVDHAWCAAVADDSTVYIGTVPDGKVHAVKDGASSLLFETGEAGVFSIAVMPDGRIAAGTGSEGKIFGISADGAGEVLADLEEPYVFALAVDDAGRLIAATGGGNGRIYSIDMDGAPSLVYESPSRHLLALARGADGRVYAASGDRGSVYAVENGRAEVLFSAPQGVVQALAVGADGTVYAGTAAIAEPKEGAEAAAVRSIIGELKARQADAPVAPAPPTPPAKREYKVTNAVYAIGAGGEVRRIFEIKAGLVLSLLARDSDLLAATAGKAGVYSIALPDNGKSLILEPECENVHFLARHPGGGFLAGFGTPGAAALVGPGRARKGTFTSRTLDPKNLARWGRIALGSSVPAGTKLTVTARSGNSSKPDTTWSDWRPVATEGGAAPDLPPARYVQYRLQMATAAPDSTPAVRRVAIAALPINLAPEVSEITLGTRKPKPPAGNERKGKSNPPSAPAAFSRTVTIAWKARDPNGDKMMFTLAFRSDGLKRFIPLESDLDKAQYTWDTTAVPDGDYHFRVTASDAPANPEGGQLEASKVEGPFTIDNTGPVLSRPEVEVDDGLVTIELEAVDAASPLKAANYGVDGGEWKTVFPVDGIFDSRTERIRLSPDKPDAAVVMIRVTDSAGNTSTTQAVLEGAEQP
jgi:hypothetical protein